MNGIKGLNNEYRIANVRCRRIKIRVTSAIDIREIRLPWGSIRPIGLHRDRSAVMMWFLVVRYWLLAKYYSPGITGFLASVALMIPLPSDGVASSTTAVVLSVVLFE